MNRTTDVVITSFNTKELITQCLESLIVQQEINTIHVIDNGSSDGSVDALLALHRINPNIYIYENQKNLGFAKACNQPLSQLNAPYVLFLNPDSVVPKNAVSNMLSFMESHPEAGMAGPLIVNADGTEQRGCRRNEPSPLRALAHFSLAKKNSVNLTGSPLPDQAIEVDAISGAFMMVRQAALAEVGKMDEGYFLHCEDLDWCKRFHLAGWKVMFVPDITIKHVKGGSSSKRRVRVEWHKHRGMVRYYRKFYRDRYPAALRLLVYASVWMRFVLFTPIWWLQSVQNRFSRHSDS